MKLSVEVRILASQFGFAPEAQMAEHVADNRAVEGSSPSGCIEFAESASWTELAGCIEFAELVGWTELAGRIEFGGV